jgi:hypothetical protein
MPARDPGKLAEWSVRMRTMNAQLKKADKRPATGLTQGGVGRKDSGARRAATKGLAKPKPLGEPNGRR